MAIKISHGLNLMSTIQSSYPISMLRQYLFCPRIPYFMVVREIQAEAPVWTSQGTSWHEVQLKLSKRRNLSRFGVGNEFKLGGVNVPVKSKSLNLHGICDAILTSNNKICPIELKTSQVSAHSKATFIQLVAYAQALVEMTGKDINEGFVLYGDRGQVIRIPIDRQKLNTVRQICNKMKQSFASCLLPNTAASEAKCCQCEYRNFCADR